MQYSKIASKLPDTQQSIEKPVKKPVGRPARWNKEIENKILRSLRLGEPLTVALLRAKISPRPYQDRINSNMEFQVKVEQSKEYAIKESRKVILNSIVKDKDTNSAKWYLERKRPDEFGGQSMQVNILQQFNDNSETDKEYGK